VLSLIPYAAAFVCSYFGISYASLQPYVDGHVQWASPQLYVSVAMNISVAMAFYGLVNFYHLVDMVRSPLPPLLLPPRLTLPVCVSSQELKWINPWPKFLCIKGVVFMTFWQGICISAMSSFGFVDPSTADSAQNFLICIEMFLASLAHYFIFPVREWEEGYREKQLKGQVVGLRDTLALRDFGRDLSRVMKAPDNYGSLYKEEAIQPIADEATGLLDTIAPSSSSPTQSTSQHTHEGRLALRRGPRRFASLRPLATQTSPRARRTARLSSNCSTCRREVATLLDTPRFQTSSRSSEPRSHTMPLWMSMAWSSRGFLRTTPSKFRASPPSLAHSHPQRQKCMFAPALPRLPHELKCDPRKIAARSAWVSCCCCCFRR
jgi:hypothetical protein